MGFGIKCSGRIADLRSRIDEEVAKGRSDKAFWKDLGEAGANSQEAVVEAEGEAEAEPRGQKRPREEGSDDGGDGRDQRRGTP